jgi:hypothetical protein
MESSSGRIPAIGFDVYVYVSVQHHSPVEGQVCDDDDDDDYDCDCDSPWTSLFDIYRMGFGWIQSLDDGAAQGDSFGHRYLYLYLYLFDVSFVGISISIACLCFVLVVWIFVVVSVTVLLVDDRHQYFL